MKYIIGLGGNLGQPLETLSSALAMLAEGLGSLVASSRFYRSKALVHPQLPVRDQADYLNGAALIESNYSPEQVLTRLLAMEETLGRVRALELLPWSPRVVDLDLLAAENSVMQSAILTLPHPQLHLRDFALLPIFEVDPQWVHPLLNKTAAELLQGLADEDRTILGVFPGS